MFKMFKSRIHTWVGLGVGLGVWASQIALTFVFPRPMIEMPATSGLADVPGIARIILQMVLIAMGIGALRAGWDRLIGLGAAMREGALAAGLSYVFVLAIPPLFQFVPLMAQHGSEPAFWDFLARAVLGLVSRQLGLATLAALGGALGGMLVVGGRKVFAVVQPTRPVESN